MNNCMDTEIQEMLPDLLHGTLAADTRARVEAHVASCEQCREELAVLRTVKSCRGLRASDQRRSGRATDPAVSEDRTGGRASGDDACRVVARRGDAWRSR